jgi:hypothetical protein
VDQAQRIHHLNIVRHRSFNGVVDPAVRALIRPTLATIVIENKVGEVVSLEREF